MQDSCDAGDDLVLDLVDYCHRKLTLLASNVTKEGATIHDKYDVTQKAGVSSLEVQESETDSAPLVLIVHTVPLKNWSVTSFFSLGEGVADAEGCAGV